MCRVGVGGGGGGGGSSSCKGIFPNFWSFQAPTQLFYRSWALLACEMAPYWGIGDKHKANTDSPSQDVDILGIRVPLTNFLFALYPGTTEPIHRLVHYLYRLPLPPKIKDCVRTEYMSVLVFLSLVPPSPIGNGRKRLPSRLTNTFHLTLKMTSAQVVESSVTNNSPFQDFSHSDDHTRQTLTRPQSSLLSPLLEVARRGDPLRSPRPRLILPGDKRGDWGRVRDKPHFVLLPEFYWDREKFHRYHT